MGFLRRLPAILSALLLLPVAAVAVALIQGGKPPIPFPHLAALAFPALASALVALLLAAAARSRLLASCTVAMGLIVAWAALPPVWHATSRHGTACAETGGRAPTEAIAVMTVNVRFGEADAARVVRLVGRHHVRILAVQELTPAFDARLAEAGLGHLLAHRRIEAAGGAAGTGLYSDEALAPLPSLSATGFAAPRAVFPWGSWRVRISAVHPAGPDPSWIDTWSREQQALAGALADADNGSPQIVLGDFNSGPGHATFRHLLRTSGLDDAGALAGLAGWPSLTWPADQGRVPLATQIDHVLVSAHFSARRVRTFPIAGSDHRAVIADLAPAALPPCSR